MSAKTTDIKPHAKIALRMAELRKKNGLSSRELARRAGLTPAQLSRIENGKQGFRCDTLLAIAGALEVDPAYLFVDDGNSKCARAVARSKASTGSVGKAMRSADFAALVEQLAEAYLHRRKAYGAIRTAARAILQGG